MLPLLIAIMAQSSIRRPFFLVNLADDWMDRWQAEGSEQMATSLFYSTALAMCEEGVLLPRGVGAVPFVW